MEKILKLLQSKNILDKKTFSGLGIGEKVFLCYSKQKAIIITSDFVSAVHLKKGLEALHKRCEIVSTGREIGKIKDENLKANMAYISLFLDNKIDYLIFLPVSVLTKFSYRSINSAKTLQINDRFDIEDFEKTMVQLGYKKLPMVSGEGEFAVRGDIIDLFATGEPNAIRIELFDDVVEKIYYYDLFTMKKIEETDCIKIKNLDLIDGEDDVSCLCENIIIDAPERISIEIEMLKESYKVMSNFDDDKLADFKNIENKAVYKFVLSGQGESHYDNRSIGRKNYLLDFLSLANDLKSYMKNYLSVILFTGDEFAKRRTGNFLIENEVFYEDYEKTSFCERKVMLSETYFPFSFSFLDLDLIVIGTEDLCKTNKKISTSTKKDVFYLPELGDYVVHKLHGIGKCVKIERMKLADFEKDYFVIEYANNSMFYLPSEQADNLSAYIGGEEKPKMNKLGGKDFFLLKEKVKNKLKEFAIDLVALYKERENAKGESFSRDEFLEQKFESAFEFEETADQLRSIEEIDKDMTSTKIMDRLVCGDVGFGKTEVAFRACFKAIYNGKQVAFLCPTTILSEQHYINAKKRMSEFGVKIELLNRFKKPKEILEIERKISAGEVDLVIGTQKMLAKSVQFKNLGLLVIDEEQRFGVADKEKIKDLKKNIDVLSLSATPIPRTLHLSLSGIRDISIIDTPPRDRLPIQTYVSEENEELIENVVKRELARGGKAFIIYNRVQDIFTFSKKIQTLLPDANIGVAHGQMTSLELKRVIDKLYQNEYNVLISTTLIENGIDLPTANTMIVVDSDKLGLSQLYQLRGRIGRSDKLAYCYLLYKKDKLLTEEALKRLQAITEFRELGSGFKVAMRDLEIRGAGNIFGKEQHGHIERVGYDMYVKLLDEAVREIKGEKVKDRKDVLVKISLDAFIPEGYIPTSEDRISYYVKISSVNSREDIQSILESLRQGFGMVPKETENLCYIAYLKNLAGEHDIQSIKINKNECKIYLEKREDVMEKEFATLLKDFNATLQFENLALISFKPSMNIKKDLEMLINFFEKAKKS